MCGIVGVVLFIVTPVVGVPKTLSSERYTGNGGTYLDAMSKLLQGLMSMFDMDWQGVGPTQKPPPLGSSNATAIGAVKTEKIAVSSN
jgi:hypothetical protein